MSRPPKLDARLQAAADSLPEGCSLAADIGADHGKLSCWLLASGRVQRMTVSDISKISRAKARDLFWEYGVLDRAEISGENGLYALKGKHGAIILAGMGGGLVSDILSQDVPLHGARLIISAHTELPLVREAIIRRGYLIEKELLTRAGGRYYRVLTAVPGMQRLSQRERLLGVGLRGTPEAPLLPYLDWQASISGKWQSEEGRLYHRLVKEAIHALEDADCAGHPGVFESGGAV